MPFKHLQNEYSLSDDTQLMDPGAIHSYLTRSYWSEGITLARVKKAIENSLCFGIFYHSRQVGFARVVSDKTSFAYLADVYILEEHRGKGLSKELMSFILSHPDLQNLRRWMLATKDAHGLYKQFGFKELDNPGNYLEIVDRMAHLRDS